MEIQHLMSRWNKLLLIGCSMFLISCENKSNQHIVLDAPQDVSKVVERPIFSSDSAYHFIQAQVDFGPRVPGSDAHKDCADWISATLERFGAEVHVQTTQLITAEQKSVPCYNIIGSYNKSAKNRILLAAHWDTRPWADQDSENRQQPILGANDGGSGVGVLLEIARQIQKDNIDLGIDIIFFDVEDSGLNNVRDSYCLGSQYWGKNLHEKDYYAQNGILLDMVGAAGAKFGLEGHSMKINPDLMNKLWEVGHKLGHKKHFVHKATPPIIDDHFYVYKNTRIPMIDIIQNDPTTMTGFGSYWHTHDDNMEIISKETLQAVGETVLATIKLK